MQTGTSEVKSKGSVVGTASYTIFDSLEECNTNLGEQQCVDLINAQVRTNELNQIRAAATGQPTKARIKDMAIDALTPEDMEECREDNAKLKALLAHKEAEIRERLGIDD